MLVVELTCRLVRILLSLLLIAASGASTATGIRLIPEKRFILAPLKINNTVELQCQVPGDATPQWKFDGEHTVYAGHNEDIVITDSNNTSVIRIEDSGLRRFRSSASADLSIDCIAYGFRYSHSERRFIVLFQAPGKPERITFSPQSGVAKWSRPENMIKEVPLSYMVIVKNVANGNITFVRENVMEESIEIPNIPECYNITVWASNKAGTSDPTIYSSPTSCSWTESTTDGGSESDSSAHFQSQVWFVCVISFLINLLPVIN